MKIKFLVIPITIVVFLFSGLSFAGLVGKIAHEKYIYPIVRVTSGHGGGSGTVIYSKCSIVPESAICAEYSTYILTNHHVIDSAISVKEEWDSKLKKDVKIESREIVYVEIFKYRNLSTPIGTLKVEADIIAYNEREDMALLKLRLTDKVAYQADLVPASKVDDLYVMDEMVAVGCSLLFPPLPSVGLLSRKNIQIESLPYHMSSAQIIYGNSGGAMFNGQGQFMGIPSRLAVIGWGTPITHMGLFIPVSRIYEWFEKEYFDFIFNLTKSESKCLEDRKNEIKEKLKDSSS